VAIVGAPYNNIGGEDDQGAAYLFEEEEQNGEITIVKQTIPDGFVGTFSFEGSDNLPLGNPCESFDLSDDDEQECGELPADTYEIVETVALDSDISISCDSGTWEVNPDGDGVIVDLSSGDDITCTFTNTLPLELGPIYPGIKNSINFMTANQATPGGKVAFVWGFQINPQVFAGPPCGGIVIDTNPFQVLGVVTADGTGSATLTFFVPALGNVVVVYTQAVDIPTCRVSDLITNILVNN
jgi:hypothetical protein